MSKKTEKVEVRMSPELKARLSAHSTTKNEAISQIIRKAVERELALNVKTSAGVRTMSPSLKFASPSFFASVIAVSVSGMLIVGSMQPATAEASVRMAFADLDRNHDGVIDRTEYDMGIIVSMDTKVEDASFADLEIAAGCGDDFGRKNLIGSPINETAEAQRTAALLDEEFARTDRNQDARISFNEFRKLQRSEMADQFYSLDKDRNGRLSRTEYAGGLFVEADGFWGDVCIEGVQGETFSLTETVVQNDATLTAEDIARAQRVEFAAADENLDGAITLEEFLNR
ncbi:MAG: hypothetical protein AAFX54_16060 [Pseudomonadota bacterium]